MRSERRVGNMLRAVTLVNYTQRMDRCTRICWYECPCYSPYQRGVKSVLFLFSLLWLLFVLLLLFLFVDYQHCYLIGISLLL